MKKLNICIIGGSGFIGTHLVRQLNDHGHLVTIFDKHKSAAFPRQCTLGDVRDQQAVTAAVSGQDVIVNLAAEHRDDVRPESLYFDVNVGGATHVCEAARQAGIKRIIFTSTVALYGLNSGRPTEESPIRPFNAYGQSKHEAEGVYKSWVHEQPERSLTIVRPVVVFGENNRGNVFNLLAHIREKRFLMVGKGDNRKSMAYVANVVDFLEFCLEQPPGLNTYNYADSPDMTTQELISIAREAFGQKSMPLSLPYWLGLSGGIFFDAVARVINRPLPISAIRIRKFCAETTVSADKAIQRGFRARFTLAEGLQTMIASEFR